MNKLPAFDEIEENFAFLDDWEDRYRYLIELGQALPPMPAGEHIGANKVSGCVSQVWLTSNQAEVNGETVLCYRSDSDAMIVKGLLAILVAIYSGKTAREISSTDALAQFDAMGLREHLTAQRSNGLVAIVGRIRKDASALL